MKPIRVVVVDDSAVMRIFLRDALSSTNEIEVVGAARDPFAARDLIKRLNPDVLTLDVLMPNMDGLDFLDRLMRLRPLPVVMFSGLTHEGSTAALQALAKGAVDFVVKPAGSEPGLWNDAVSELISKIKFAATARLQPTVQGRTHPGDLPSIANWPSNRIVAIGASTGGVQALRHVLGALPAKAPPIVIAQHMPANFTRSFAKRLDAHCAVAVCEAVDGAPVVEGAVYIAPGDRHLVLERRGANYMCRLQDGAEHNGHMPSIDLMFQSVAAAAGPAAMGILMTGMGRDGAQGLNDIRQAGGVTATQNEATSVIYGMPKAAVEIGAAQYELPIDGLAPFILQTRPGRRYAIAADKNDLIAAQSA